MASHRFLFSALLTGAIVLATMSVAVADFTGNYALSNATETGNATFYDTVPSYNPTPVQLVPVANATVTANGTFTLTASGTLPVIGKKAAQPITGTVDGNGTIVVKGPKGSTGVGVFVGSNMTLTCAYLLPGGRVTYHYTFILVPSP